MNAPTASQWKWPVLLCLLSLSGLASALLADGWGDAWAWVSLGLPLAAIMWFAVPFKQSSLSEKQFLEK